MRAIFPSCAYHFGLDLLRTALENQRRQQDRIRLFEHGARFVTQNGNTQEIDSLAGLILGARLPEQWGAPEQGKTPVDFSMPRATLRHSSERPRIAMRSPAKPLRSAVYTPGAPRASCADCRQRRRRRRQRDFRMLQRRGKQSTIEVGWIGELHPTLVRELGFTQAPVLFELDLARALRVKLPRFREISRFPQVRRDIAVVVDESGFKCLG